MARNIYTGFHAVEERIRRSAQKKNDSVKLSVLFSKPGPRIKKILSQAAEVGIDCRQVSTEELDVLTKSLPETARDHRGIILIADGEEEMASNIVQLDQWIQSSPEKATVVVLDSVTDPHNVGAVLRSCDQFGVDLVLIPERNSSSDVQDNQVIARSSAGASAWVPYSVVPNLVRAVQMLKESGFWIYGADAGGKSVAGIEFAQKTCIVMGSEGSGIARLLSEKCDQIVSIPTCGKIDSLNVSVATGILLYERFRQNIGKI